MLKIKNFGNLIQQEIKKIIFKHQKLKNEIILFVAYSILAV